jgi:hypothetical protein
VTFRMYFGPKHLHIVTDYPASARA